MIPFLSLLAWMTFGACIAVRAPGDRGRAAWIPVALFFGPLWMMVAVDQERAQ